MPSAYLRRFRSLRRANLSSLHRVCEIAACPVLGNAGFARFERAFARKTRSAGRIAHWPDSCWWRTDCCRLSAQTMTISGLVVTLSDEPDARSEALSHIARDCRLTTGELVRNRLPLVAETDDEREGEALVDALLDVPGIRFVDLISVHFCCDE